MNRMTDGHIIHVVFNRVMFDFGLMSNNLYVFSVMSVTGMTNYPIIRGKARQQLNDAFFNRYCDR